MPVAFNPMNPMSFWASAWGFGSTTSARTPSTGPASAVGVDAPKAPAIAIDARASDTGIVIKTGANSVTISGTTDGSGTMNDIFGFPAAELARSVSFSLDIDKAKTTDVFGRTDYREKNSRRYVLMTGKGMSATDVAQRLASKVNGEDDFRAKVATNADGSSTISFTHR